MILRFSNDKQKYAIITISAILIIAVVTFAVNKIIEIYTVHQVFAAYNMLTEAYQTSLKNEKYEWTKEKMNVNVLANKYIKYLPVKKDCAKRDNTCFAPYVRYKNKVGLINLSKMSEFRKAELKNGMTVAVGIQHPACDGPRGRCGSVFVDINGKKGPNLISNCLGSGTMKPAAAQNDTAGNCGDKSKRVIKDQFGVRLRGSFAVPNGAASRWAFEN